MKLTFTDTQERFYVLDGKNLHAEPGKEYELDSDPGDGRWSGGVSPVVTSLSAESAPPVSLATALAAAPKPSSDLPTQPTEGA